ncbi:MAG: hypothetical protein KGJ87_08790 [Planctomycetota bacterium]|nr:hypothetical protein [Planctomycetota bacterium]MDE1889583.1 hypothetical protein [Planctomycetota bacterium]MDE2217237.1 hypothetical protein [Planctomycetota bacterium]
MDCQYRHESFFVIIVVINYLHTRKKASISFQEKVYNAKCHCEERSGCEAKPKQTRKDSSPRSEQAPQSLAMIAPQIASLPLAMTINL